MPTVYEETTGSLEDCDTVETNTKICFLKLQHLPGISKHFCQSNLFDFKYLLKI